MTASDSYRARADALIASSNPKARTMNATDRPWEPFCDAIENAPPELVICVFYRVIQALREAYRDHADGWSPEELEDADQLDRRLCEHLVAHGWADIETIMIR
ncbi:hypothetical protein [Streptomyces halobius]|uniref:Uncharacterized protein n=1 Tax=Streptomyces halobius TaxID=2879846 RepID=A0ABY4M8D4_9ACTN|nr:hypothetical protein [Streptomyces halobius]UQA92665.1 hypothetical protein K9S39_13250 [Streptomyces halobius]